MKRITDKELTAITNDVNKAALTVIAHAATDMAKADDFAPGLKAPVGHEGGRGSDISDPTGNTVVAKSGTDDKGREVWSDDQTAQYSADYRAALRGLAFAADTYLRMHNRINFKAEHKPGRTSRVWQCVNRNCGDDIILPDGQVPHQGRCGPCAVYRTKHDLDATPKVVAARRRQRKVKT